MPEESLTPVTKCEGCVFAKIEDIQTGCDLERHTKLGIISDDKDETFTLKRFCNTYRPDKWLSDLDFDQRLDIESEVMKEIYPKVGFIINFDLESENPIGNLEKTLKSIPQAENGTLYVVVVNEKVEYNEEIWGSFISNFGEVSKIKYHIVQLNHVYSDIDMLIDQSFTHAQNGWVQCLTSGDEVDENCIGKIHELINIKMKKLIMILPKNEKDPFSGLVFPAYLFKFLNGNGVKVFRDEKADSRSFITKVLEAEKRGETKTVYTWEEFYAA